MQLCVRVNLFKSTAMTVISIHVTIKQVAQEMSNDKQGALKGLLSNRKGIPTPFDLFSL